MGIYLDNAATSYPKPEPVYEAVYRFMRELGATSGRGAYSRALKADRVVFETRRALARLFNVKDASRIVFTSNVTEALNLAIKGLLNPGDHVVTSSMEHNAVWRPLKAMERERGVTLTQVVCTPDGRLDPADVEREIRKETRLVVLTHASNVTGTIMPIEEVGRICRKRGVVFLVDAAQTAGAYPIDVERENVDMLAFTGHKSLLGPMGTGGLYIAEGVELRPLKEGGTGGDSLLERQPNYLPDRFEAGTLNVGGIAGLGAAVEYILGEGVERIRAKERSLTEYLLQRLGAVDGVRIYGPVDPEMQVGVISFNVADFPPEEVAYVLDDVYGIMVRAGLHCAPCAHRTVGTVDTGTVRVGLGCFNTEEHVDALVSAVGEIARERC